VYFQIWNSLTMIPVISYTLPLFSFSLPACQTAWMWKDLKYVAVLGARYVEEQPVKSAGIPLHS
jgi:hypothetical protein